MLPGVSISTRFREAIQQIEKARSILTNEDKTGQLNFHDVTIAKNIAAVEGLADTLRALKQRYQAAKKLSEVDEESLGDCEMELGEIMQILAPVNSDEELMEEDAEPVKSPAPTPPRAKPRTQVAVAHTDEGTSHAVAIARSTKSKSPSPVTVTTSAGASGPTIHVNITNAASSTASAEATGVKGQENPPTYKEAVVAAPDLSKMSTIERAKYLHEQATKAEAERQEALRVGRLANTAVFTVKAVSDLNAKKEEIRNLQESRLALIVQGYDECIAWLFAESESRSQIMMSPLLTDAQKKAALSATPRFASLQTAWAYFAMKSDHTQDMELIARMVAEYDQKLKDLHVEPDTYYVNHYLDDRPHLKTAEIKSVLFPVSSSEDYVRKNSHLFQVRDFSKPAQS